MTDDVKNIMPDNDIEVKIIENEVDELKDASSLIIDQEEPQQSTEPDDLSKTVDSLKSELEEIKKEPYSDRVKTRIAREVSKRKAEEDKTRLLEERLAKLESAAQTQDKNTLENQYQTVSKDLKEAIEGGDTEKQVKLMDEMADVRSRIQTVQKAPPEVKPKETVVPEITREWISKNSHWWNKTGHRGATQTAFGIDADLTDEGYDVAEPDYYEEMNKRMSKLYPELIKPEENPVQDEQKDVENKPRVQSPVAGVSRSNQGTAKSVRLTSNDLQNAVTFGIDINDPNALKRYAKELANLNTGA
jgi:hypothetical protein|tara:strand:- start:2123 stop:3031 length:909 start_codon:yes stop_codon:yes gene_type:complete